MQLEPSTVPLPATIQRALAAIAKDLTDMPRDCARDREEMIFWHARLARRLRGVLVMRVPVERPIVGVLTKNDIPKPSRRKSQTTRIIRAHNGRMVRVETRQLEMLI